MLKTFFEMESVIQKESTLPCSKLTGPELTTLGISPSILNKDLASSYKSRSGGIGKGPNEGAAAVGSELGVGVTAGMAVAEGEAVAVCAAVAAAVGVSTVVGVGPAGSEVGVGVLPVSQPTSRIETATANDSTKLRVLLSHKGRNILLTGMWLIGVNFRGYLRLGLGEAHPRRR